jgi:transposase, IS5 family
LGDGVRVLTRSMHKITALTGAVGAKLRDRSRSVKWRVLEIARAARGKTAPSRERLKAAYRSQLQASSRVVGQAKGVKRWAEIVKQTALEGHRQRLDVLVPRVQQVMRQAKARIFRGDTRSEGKIVRLFEPSTEVIRKGKASRPTESGKLVKLQEAEYQMVVAHEVYARRPYDSDLLMPAIEVHAAKLGRIPRLVAVDAGFYSDKNEVAAKAKGVTRVCIPNRASKSAARKREQKKRWFRDRQRWRTECEERISVSKRRHGLQRCRYRGDDGMRRSVGLGVIADNLINIGRGIAAQRPRSPLSPTDRHIARSRRSSTGGSNVFAATSLSGAMGDRDSAPESS